MSKYARVVDDTVVEVVDRSPNEIFNSTVAAMFQLCPDEVDRGWALDGEMWSPPQQQQATAVFKVLSPLAFLDLCITAGGMTNELFAQAWVDAQLSAFRGMFSLTTEVEKEDPRTLMGLNVLQQLGYLPEGVQAVMNAWPEA